MCSSIWLTILLMLDFSPLYFPQTANNNKQICIYGFLFSKWIRIEIQRGGKIAFFIISKQNTTVLIRHMVKYLYDLDVFFLYEKPFADNINVWLCSWNCVYAQHSVKPVSLFWTKAAEIIHMRLHPSSLTYADHWWSRVKHTHTHARTRKKGTEWYSDIVNLTFLTKILTNTRSPGSRLRLSSWVLNKPASFSEEEPRE